MWLCIIKHKWSKWETFLWVGEIFPSPMGIMMGDPPIWLPHQEWRQKRDCLRCGFHQEQKID